MRTKIVAGNWKMNKSFEEAKSLTAEVIALSKAEVKSNAKVVLCVPFPYLISTRDQVSGTGILVGAQNCSDQESGAYTGEVSAAMLKSVGIPYVIIGHSERRQYFGEDGKLLAKKTDKALAHGLTPIFCCGEPLEIREKGTHEDIVRDQVEESLFHLSADLMKKVVIAYEPVWAIGTGKTATSQQAQDMHAVIRKQLAKRYGEAVGEEVPILYGGSVKPDNAKELFSCPDVDGGLVGGASLKARDFIDIVKGA
ncbi:MAG TPA: triose-phosphate isomerase [Cyclobacteriaceae bacterium]|nr:triose-phosphate isomerase [Cyclobacteriaceae bacterium]